MRRRAIVAAIFGLLWLAPARIVAENTDPEVSGTFHFRNGRYWNRLSKAEKLVYLLGLADAVTAVSATTSDTYENFKKATGLYFGEATYGEVIDGLNALYAEPENRQIAILDGMIWYQLKARGATAAGLQQALEKLRAGVNDK